ncbi:RUS family member 1-like isoform X1 [Hydractinia symbiolongicarpus]|uniref:RUS family member 1-like isoform X1 n=1 Tax=Hydractinia symbiolongicarpus TaxID=13093 RepID=UPI00254E9ECC|nr:RUS family member 1-like isoform X1 [Hydractinia symbiolongicarpus]
MDMEIIAQECYGSEQNVCVVNNEGILVARKVLSNTTRSSIATSVKKFFVSAFLPQGYPDSVSKDYLQYQLWDTLQAFCSSITGTLATQAVLKGYGVGDKTATAAAATITWMVKDGTGMIGRIIFAWLKGTQLDCDAKRWRLYADILNDIAILLDLIAPVFKTYFLFIACLSSISRSIVGVAGGATRAALTLHQARRDNMADVSAKDGSQETLVNLMALVAGFIITPLVADNQMLVWILFSIFTSLHLLSNYKAVSTVVMETINLPRFYILLNNYLRNNDILSPDEVAKLDPVLSRPGYTSSINIGVPLTYAVKSHDDFAYAMSPNLFKTTYIIGYNKTTRTVNIVLHKGISDQDIRKSCFHALLLDTLMHNHKQTEKFTTEIQSRIFGINMHTNVWNIINDTKKFVDDIYLSFEKGLEAKGWDLSRCHLGLDEWRIEWNKKTL